MSRPRNPFRLRASEKIESEASFLRIYNPTILESLLEKDKNSRLWNSVLYIRSSPGAGKTSLLRIFEPDTLNTLLNSRSAQDYTSIFSLLKKMDVMTDREVNVLGVLLVCTRNYEILEELEVANAQKTRYFFSLLNARIILATLKSIVGFSTSNELFNEVLERITYTYDDRDNYFIDLATPCTGRQLYQWASAIEKGIYQAIDSFLPIADVKPRGHSELFAFSVLRPEYFLFDGKSIFKKILFMLDDAHKLSATQRQSLKKYIIEKRGQFTVWVSERLEALEPIDNLRSFEERDYEELNLEKFWSERPTKFENVLANIADKRASISSEEVSSFREYLDNNLEEEKLDQDFKLSIRKSQEVLQKISSYTNKFVHWINYVEGLDVSILEKATLYKKLEILVHRNLGKTQLSFEFPFTKEEFLERIKNDIDVSSKLFLSKSADVPYYYGFSSLAKLSSNNIEQFLAFSANLFEQMLSNRLLGYRTNIDTEEQEKILTEVVEMKWNELSKVLPHSSSIINFLTRLGEFCKNETYQPNAPYASGVTGFAIKVDNSLFKSGNVWYEQEFYSPLATAISTCVAFNLLEVKEVAQGEKGSKWDVYYLNRWLCVKFELPFSYGGWRHKKADELLKWLKG